MRLGSLHTYPVKGCHRLDHDGARVDPWGLAGDRRWLVVDADGVGVTQRDTTALVRLRAEPRAGGVVLRAAGRPDLDVPEPVAGPPESIRVFSKFDPVGGRAAGAAADAWLSELLECPVRLVWQAEPHALSADRAGAPGDRVTYADTHPLLLTTTASLDAFNDWLVASGGEPVPMTRFRPNVVVSGAQAWAEDGWLGQRLRIGDVDFRVAGSCKRCVVVNVDQESGVRGTEVLRVLGRYRDHGRALMFGVKLIPDGTGDIRVGDRLGLISP